MIRTSLFVIATTFLIAFFVFQDRTERKVALVLSVTSNDYHTSREFFDTPTPDVALTLSKLGFEVIESIEPDRTTLVKRMQEFAASLKTADVGLIYYSGNIAQFSGRSYLIPADMKVNQPWLFETYGVSIDPLLHEMGRQVRHSFVFLNACRLSWSRYDKRCYGLSRIGAGRNILVTHANQPTGNKYPHRQNEAVFVKALTANLMKRDMPVNQVLRNIYMDVNIATRSEQVPWTENGRGKRFVFNKTKAIPFEQWKSFPPKVASIIPITLEKPVEVKISQVAAVQKAPDIVVKDKKPVAEPVKVAEPEKKLSQLRMDKKTAIQVMQKKLASFSCYSGRIDGIWGRRSKRAVRKFRKRVKVAGLTTQPDLELFKVVARYEGPVCGRACADGKRKGRDGQCRAVEQASLHYIPVIMEEDTAPVKVRVAKKAKKRKLLRKAKTRRKVTRLRKKRSRRYRARTRRHRKTYRKRARRRYAGKRSRSRRSRNRSSRRYAQYRKNPFRKISN
ncbi:MAG: caspase family protein [Methyloligellaceae bacterium]